MINTTGRLLALNLAAADTTASVHDLVQRHLDTYPRDEALLILAVALGTLAGDILIPAVNRMSEADEWRNRHAEAVRQIIAGPTEKE